MTTIQNDMAEALMKERGRERERKRVEEAVKRGDVSQAGPYKAVIALATTLSHEEIQGRLDSRGRGNNRALTALLDTGLDGKTLAALALQSLMNSVVTGSTCTVQSATENLGRCVEDEVRVRWLAKEAPGLVKFLEKENARKGTTDYAHRRAVLMSAIPRLEVAETWQRWDLRTKALVGMWLADVFTGLGVFETVQLGSGRNMRAYLRLTEAAERELLTMGERMLEIARPEFRPMLAPPAPWTSPTEGGYHRLDVPLMKRAKREDVLRLKRAEMPTVYSAVNAVQATAWSVNEDVLVVAEELKRQGVPIKGLPEAASLSQPVRPASIPLEGELDEEQKALLAEYKVARRAWFDAEAQRSSRAMLSLQTLAVARENASEAAIYFPHQLDFRGRIYAVPQGLNPQGNDLSKGLLTFAEGKPLGAWGSYWLAIHGANSYGKDKGPLNDRVDWVVEHEAEILEAAEDPMGTTWWREADGGESPWQFLAFCFEWAGYIESGESPDFVSHLPVAVDGSCNGLQHYSAILRDPVGAHAVNLTRDGEQQDIYVKVAEATEALVKEKMNESATDRELAGLWLAHGVTRKVVKRSVMTTPYGVTGRGIVSHVFMDTTKGSDVFGGQAFEASAWLGPLIMEAIGSTVSAAEEAMAFLRGVVKVTNKANSGLGWTTPAGLPVMQKAPNLRRRRVKTKLLGKVDLIFVEEGDGIDKGKQSSSVAPNFVHSMDAAHLMLTVGGFEQAFGSTSWAMVHDSFGTHAGEVHDLGIVLRREFVRMYRTHQPLDELLAGAYTVVGEDAELPGVPPAGSFNLMEVLDAEFFFA
jgi:DNA-directed RNA polymerase